MVLIAASFAGVFSVWAAILYFQLRHIGLTALVFAVPLSLVCLACAFWRPIVSFEADNPYAGGGYAFTSYVLAIVAAQTIGNDIARGICDGLARRAATSRALARNLKFAGAGVIAVALWMVVTSPGPVSHHNLLAAAILLAFWIGTLALMCTAMWLPYSEAFIARANQAREARERIFDKLLFIAELRWSWSLTGVAVIFAALSVFGMRTLQIEDALWLGERFVALAVFGFAGAIAVTRDWRLGVAWVLTLALLGVVGVWIFARGYEPLEREQVMDIGILLAAGAVPLTYMAAAVSAHLREGDSPSLALARALREQGANAVLSALLFCVPCIVVAIAGGGRLEAGISLASLVAAPLIFPALAGALYAILPRYRTVDEVFGKR